MLQITVSIIANIMTHEANDYIFKPFFLFPIISSPTFHYSSLYYRSSSSSFLWCGSLSLFHFFLLLVLLHFILLVFVANLLVVPSYDVNLRDLDKCKNLNHLIYDLWFFLISIFNPNNNLYIYIKPKLLTLPQFSTSSQY